MATGAAALLERALDPAVVPPDDEASGRILDATVDLAAASGIRHLTMDDVARRAGVGRMTVYRRFGDRETLLSALAAREARRCLADLDAAVDPAEPIADQVAAGFIASLRLVREHPLLDRFARLEPEAALEALNANGGAIVALSRAFVAARIAEAQRAGTVAEVDADAAAEVLVRLGFSFLLIPGSALPLDDPEAIKSLVGEMLAPLIAPAS